MSLYSQTYETPWSYNEEEAVVPLASFNFTVTDAITGSPIEGALCMIYAGLDGTGDADGGYTDANGIFGIDAEWFAPKSWGASKEGYLRKVSNLVVSDIRVALEPTTVLYTVRIFAGTGGITDPSGTLTVVPNTQLTVTAIPNSGYEFDYWVYKGENVGSVNPLTFLIDRDAITITAIFKEVVEPPPNEEPPNNEWPHTAIIHFSGRLAPGWVQEAKDSTPIKNVDLTKLLGGRVDYALKYESGKLLTGITLYIYWNEELMATEAFLIGQVGKTITGTFNLGIARIRATNVLTIKMSQAPLGYNVCSFDCPTVLGFSEEPDQPPSGKDWWDAFLEWLDKYKYWIALGVVGASVLLMYRPAPVIIYQPPGKRGG